MEPQLNNVIVNDLETCSQNQVVPYCVSLFRLSRVTHLYNRDLANKEHEKCKKDTIVFEGECCFEKLMVWLSGLKGEPRKVGKKMLSIIYR